MSRHTTSLAISAAVALFLSVPAMAAGLSTRDELSAVGERCEPVMAGSAAREPTGVDWHRRDAAHGPGTEFHIRR